MRCSNQGLTIFDQALAPHILMMDDLEGNVGEQGSDAGSPQVSCNNRHEQKPKCFPVFVLLATLVNWFLYMYGIVFLIDNARVALNGPISPPISSWYYYTVTSYPKCTDCRGDALRMFMYQFVHSGLMHLGGNSLALLTYGAIYNMYCGTRLLAAGVIYQTAIYMGALGHSLIWPYRGLIGCSPGVYGLIGACWVLMLCNWHKMDFIVAFIMPFVLVAQLAGDVVSYLLMYSTGTGYASHFFGFCTGVTLSLSFLLWDSKSNEWWKKCIGMIGLCAFGVMAVYLITHSVQHWPPEPFKRSFLHNSKEITCCAQLLHYAQEQGQSMDEARQETYCFDSVLYQHQQP